MGIVYKFRKEVIDFVLHQKRTDHDLGCRQLAALNREKFKIQVSKSSINAIIKNANLSNTVGRPLSTESSPKKFQIPVQKKQQLSDEIRKVKLDNVMIEQEPLLAKTLQQPKKTTFVEPQPPGASSRRPPGFPLQGPTGLREEPLGQTAFLRHVEDLRARRAQNKGIMREGTGCVFLKAAQWQLSRTSVLGGLLRKHIQESLPARFDAFCDVLPCLSLLGEYGSGQSGRPADHALWHLNGFDRPLSDPEISHWESVIGAVSPSIKFSLEYEKEKRQVFLEAKRFEFYLENDSRVVTDACLAGLGEENLPAGFSSCAQQAMTLLSHCVISNNRPSLFLSSASRPLGGKRQFSRDALDMVAALEGTEGKQFKKAAVFDSAGERVAEFSSFPRKKRFLMLGVWPWQEEFLLLSKDIKMVEPFYDEATDRILCVAAGPATAFQKEWKMKEASLRSITVLPSPESAPIMVILTNCADSAPTDIVAAFLRRWPNLDAGPAGRALRAEGISGAGNAPVRSPQVIQNDLQDPSLVCRDWGNVLSKYCQRHFLCEEFAGIDAASLISAFYSLPGYCVARQQALLISLCPPGAYSFLNELRQAVQRINEAGIMDPLGRT